MNTEMPHLKIEILPGGLIRLENIDCGDSYAIDLHLVQLRYLAEQTGLIRMVSASNADTMRTCEERGRRLMALKIRIDHLGEYLALHSDHEHADLSYETTYAAATADVCDAYCADIVAGNAPSVSNALVTRESRDVTPCPDAERQLSRGTDEGQQRGASAPGADPRRPAQLEIAACQ